MNRTEIETKVTEAIVASLESGVAPWTKPWVSAAGDLPLSLSTGRPYRGGNMMILALLKQMGGYESPFWGTFRQINGFGGRVRKGEEATPVVFWKMIEKEDGDKLPLLRYYNVFNLDQTEGVELPPRASKLIESDLPPVEVPAAVESVLAAYVGGPAIVHERGDSATYSPAQDRIRLPELDQFARPEDYAGTLFHELVHSTGHPDRLSRITAGSTQFGCELYAEEELVAEIGAQMLAATAGISLEIERSAAYVENWLGVLKGDRGLILKAAQRAQKAVDRIMGTTFGEEVSE
jgi:antirestriction protein ArdC